MERREQSAKWNKAYCQQGTLWTGKPRFGFALPSGARVLELGCGNGKTLAALPKDCVITAIDSSKKAVELCRAAAPGARVLQADACELPFGQGEFDAVVAFHVLDHLAAADRDKAVAEIRRVLAPGGRVFVKVFSTNDMRCGKGRPAGEAGTFLRGKDGIIYHYFTEGELNALFSRFRQKSLCPDRRKVRYRSGDYQREELAAEYEK